MLEEDERIVVAPPDRLAQREVPKMQQSGAAERPDVDPILLSRQQAHWGKTYATHAEMFGREPSAPAQAAAALFLAERKTDLLELGAGQGRDTLFFAGQGLRIHALDYSQEAAAAIADKATTAGLATAIAVACHDVRAPLPFADERFDACYSHMLFCMALTTAELERLATDVRRVLRPGGLHVYTVRTIADPHYGTGIDRGDDMYEVGGFIVHFFGRALVDRLAAGYELLSVDEFEESTLPRRLVRVSLRKV